MRHVGAWIAVGVLSDFTPSCRFHFIFRRFSGVRRGEFVRVCHGVVVSITTYFIYSITGGSLAHATSSEISSRVSEPMTVHGQTGSSPGSFFDLWAAQRSYSVSHNSSSEGTRDASGSIVVMR